MSNLLDCIIEDFEDTKEELIVRIKELVEILNAHYEEKKLVEEKIKTLKELKNNISLKLVH